MRHVPIYCLIASPLIAERLEDLWSTWCAGKPARSVAGVLRQMDIDWKLTPLGFSLTPAVISLVLIGMAGTAAWSTEFPSHAFPTAMVERNIQMLSSPGVTPVRIFSTDQWSDFLIYRLQAHARIFVDGRSDFFGPSRGGEYSG